MKKIFIFIALIIVLGGCSIIKAPLTNPLTNQQIIEQSKLCTDAGMFPNQIYDTWTYDVHKVQCVPLSEDLPTK